MLMLKFRADFIYLLNKTPTNKQTHTKKKAANKKPHQNKNQSNKHTKPKKPPTHNITPPTFCGFSSVEHLELSVKSVPFTNSAVLAINTAL